MTAWPELEVKETFGMTGKPEIGEQVCVYHCKKKLSIFPPPAAGDVTYQPLPEQE